MDFVRYAIQELEIHSFMIQIRILSTILQTFSTTLHSPNHTRMSYVGTILIMALIVPKNVPHDAIKLMLFPFSFEGAAQIWLEKEPPRSIHTWEDLVSKFVNYFFHPSKTTNLKNDITNFQQRFNETFSEAWDRFKDLLPAGGNLLNRTLRDALIIIENKSKVRTSRNKSVVSKASTTSSSTPAYLPEITTLTDAVTAMLLQNKTPSPAPVKAIEEICVTYGGPHPYYECLATDGNTFNASAATGTYNQGGPGYRPQGETNYRTSNQMRPPGNQNYQVPLNQTQVGPSNDFSNYMKTNDVNMRAMQNQINNMKAEFKNEVQTMMRNQSNKLKNMMSSFFQMQSPSGSGSLPSNIVANSRGDLKAITIRSGVSYDEPTIPTTSSPLPKEVEREPGATNDKSDVALKPNPKPSIPYPSRLNDQKLRQKAKNQMLKFLQIFQRLHFDLSFADALLHSLSRVDYDVDPRIPLKSGAFLKDGTSKNLCTKHEELTQLINDDITLMSGHNYEIPNRYDDELFIALMTLDVPYPIITTSSLSLTPFEGGDFILEEIEACLTSDLILPGIDDDDFDPEGDILLLEKLLNDDPSSPLPSKELNFE
ncbi:reverse transcriptase domain-containing protein [Tanacetum coccineum]